MTTTRLVFTQKKVAVFLKEQLKFTTRFIIAILINTFRFSHISSAYGVSLKRQTTAQHKL